MSNKCLLGLMTSSNDENIHPKDSDTPFQRIKRGFVEQMDGRNHSTLTQSRILLQQSCRDRRFINSDSMNCH